MNLFKVYAERAFLEFGPLSVTTVTVHKLEAFHYCRYSDKFLQNDIHASILFA